MVINYIFISFFLLAFATALARLLFQGNTEVFTAMVNATFESAKTAFEISLGLTGVLALWLGLMKVGENAGLVQGLSRLVAPFFRRLFPGIPAGHPANGSMMLNFAANMLGLDNAATPLGLKAMQELQDLNPDKETATDAQIMFLVLNTSGLTVIPVSVMVYRAQMGSANPADIFLPILLATYFSTIAGLIAVALWQRINLLDKVVLAYLGGVSAFVFGLLWYFSGLPQEEVSRISAITANIILTSIIALFIGAGLIRRVNVWESFIEGAKEGFQTAVRIIPYLVAILVGIGVFRASGAMEAFVGAIRAVVSALGLDTRWVDALPVALMKPLSGSGARGLMVDTFTTFGVDSFAGRLAATFQGASDTTFYILAVYFGSVGVRKTRYAVTGGLIADLAGVVAAIAIAYIFFG